MKTKTKRKYKLKYQLGIDPCDDCFVVHFQVLDQDPRFLGGEYRAPNGLRVWSDGGPELTTDTVFLRGERPDFNNDAVTLEFNTEADAQDYVARVHAALKAWAKNWRGFRSPAKPSIYTV